MANSKTAPILENEHVKELLAIMRENNAPTTQDFLAVLHQVGAMERQLDAAVRELAAMRRELNEAREQNHPIKTALQNTVKALEKNVAALRERLDEAKQTIIGGCKNAVAAFKEKGIAALDNVARFFKVRPILETMRDDLNENIRFDDKAIAKIEAMSAEYHQAGRHLKNMGRAMLGKEAIQETKPPGMVAKAMLAPFRAERSHFAVMKKNVEAAIGNLARLEERAKPSIQKAMQTHKKQAEQAKKDAPAAERPCPANAER
jgi:hypothetical protein